MINLMDALRKSVAQAKGHKKIPPTKPSAARRLKTAKHSRARRTA